MARGRQAEASALCLQATQVPYEASLLTSCSPGHCSDSRDTQSVAPTPFTPRWWALLGVTSPRALAGALPLTAAPRLSISPLPASPSLQSILGKSPALQASPPPQCLNPVPCTVRVFSEDFSTLKVCCYQAGTRHNIHMTKMHREKLF